MWRMVAAFVCFAVPAAAWSQIYAWVDDKGVTVFSNIRPADTRRLKDFHVAMEEEKPAPIPPAIAAQQSVQAAQADALRRDQELEDRIEDLERRIQAQQYQAQAPTAPAPADYYDGSYYPGFVYPYGLSFVIPSRTIPHRRFVKGGRIVNSGPVFVTPRGPSSRFVPGVFLPRFQTPRTFASPRFAPRTGSFSARGMGGRR